MNNYKLIKKMQPLRKWYALTAIEQALFYELIELCNQAGWTDTFTCSNPSLCQGLNLSEKSLIRARNRLVDSGLISYRRGKSTRCQGIYSLCMDLDSREELRERIPEVDPACCPGFSKGNLTEDTEEMPHEANDPTTGMTPDMTTVNTPDKMGDSVPAFNKTKTKTKEKIKKECVSLERKVKEKFELFRQAYPGTKRGADTEVTNFRKKHPDYAKVTDELLPAVERLKQWRAQLRIHGMFVPPYPLLSTWINQRRWEAELENPNSEADENQPIVIL